MHIPHGSGKVSSVFKIIVFSNWHKKQNRTWGGAAGEWGGDQDKETQLNSFKYVGFYSWPTFFFVFWKQILLASKQAHGKPTSSGSELGMRLMTLWTLSERGVCRVPRTVCSFKMSHRWQKLSVSLVGNRLLASPLVTKLGPTFCTVLCTWSALKKTAI